MTDTRRFADNPRYEAKKGVDKNNNPTTRYRKSPPEINSPVLGLVASREQAFEGLFQSHEKWDAMKTQLHAEHGENPADKNHIERSHEAIETMSEMIEARKVLVESFRI